MAIRILVITLIIEAVIYLSYKVKVGAIWKLLKHIH